MPYRAAAHAAMLERSEQLRLQDHIRDDCRHQRDVHGERIEGWTIIRAKRPSKFVYAGWVTVGSTEAPT